MNPSNERRFVAVLFAEVPGLSAAVERLGVDDGSRFADDLFRRMRAAVEARGGTVDKFMGEGVMAVFGAPVAHGDDAARASLAALDLRREAESFAARGGPEFGFHAGVNAGEVLWAGVAGEKATAMGDAVNVAQRLQAEAPPGKILVSASVEALARRRARFLPFGTIRVRGRVEPVEAFDCAGPKEGGTGAYSGMETPFVGRERELELLAASRGTGKSAFLWVEGEAGIGKTRLLDAARETVSRHGWTASGRAAKGGGVPLAAMGRAMRAAGRREGAAEIVPWLLAGFATGGVTGIEAENLSHLIALSIGELVAEARVAALEPERRRKEMLFAWEQWLRLRASREPVTLFLDDLHDADPESLALLSHLASRLRDSPFAIFAAARPGGSPPAGFQVMPLGQLDDAGSRKLAEATFSRPASDELLDFVVTRAAGNPFAVSELARHIQEERLAAGDPLNLVAPAEGIPRGLQPLLQARLDALGPTLKETLKSASVIGQTFWAGSLQRLCGADVSEALSTAERLGIFVRPEDSTLAGEQEYSFRDALLRDAAYALLPRRDRARLHATVADDFEALVGTAGRRARALAAEHRFAAGDAPASSALWILACQDAVNIGLTGEGLAYAEEARRAQDSPAARLVLARSLIATNRNAEARDLSLSVTSDPTSTRDQVLNAQLNYANAQMSMGNPEESLRAIDAVMAAKPPAPLELNAHQGAAAVLYEAGRLAEALVHVEAVRVGLAALKSTSSAALPVQLHDTRLIKVLVLLRMGDMDAAHRELDELAITARASGRIGALANILLNRGNLRFLKGEIDAAEENYREALESSRRLGDRIRATAALQNLSNIDFLRGEFRAALEVDLDVLRLRREVGDTRMLGATLVNVGASRMVLGERDLATRDFEEALRVCRATSDVYNETMGLTYLAEIKRRSGRFGEARADCDVAIELAEKHGFSPLLATALQLCGRLMLPDDAPGAEKVLTRSMELARVHHDPRVEAAATSAFAVLLVRQGRAAEAAGYVERALALAPMATACSDRLLVLEDVARVRLATGDAAGARAAISEGETAAKRSGAAEFATIFATLRKEVSR